MKVFLNCLLYNVINVIKNYYTITCVTIEKWKFYNNRKQAKLECKTFRENFEMLYSETR